MNYRAFPEGEPEITILYQVQEIKGEDWAPASGNLSGAEEAFTLENVLQKKTGKPHRVVKITTTTTTEVIFADNK